MMEFLNGEDAEYLDLKEQVIYTMDVNNRWSQERRKEIEEFLCSKNPYYEGCSKADDSNKRRESQIKKVESQKHIQGKASFVSSTILIITLTVSLLICNTFEAVVY